MKAHEIITAIKAAYNTNKRPICIEGPPGGGKTSVVKQAAKELEIGFTIIHLPTAMVEDFGVPLPVHDGKTLDYFIPEWFPRDPDSKGILCFDDRNQGSSDIQKALANIMQERSLHGHKLPDGWMVVSTGNRIQDRAGANKVLSHVRNRETAITMTTDINDWTVWALANDIHPSVIGFLQFKTDMLHPEDGVAVAATDNGAFPSPRSWSEGVSPMVGELPPGLEHEFFAGAVGPRAATEFAAFVKIYRELPDMNDVIAYPEKFKVPTNPSTKYAIITALAVRCDDDNCSNVITAMYMIGNEFSVLGMNLLQRRHNPKIFACKAFTKWATENQDLVLGGK